MQANTRIELHYSTGGHGGPYFGEQDAIDAAVLLIRGCRHERWIALRAGVAGPLIGTVHRDENDITFYIPHR